MTMNGAGNGVAEALDRSVQVQPRYDDPPRSGLVLQLATVADDMPAWGTSVSRRDRALREFWPTEPVLASAVYSIVARNSAFSWKLDGPPRTVAVTQRILHEADLGGGWLNFMVKVTTDLLTQDNGAFIEIIRSGERESDPVIGVAHLDAGRCIRTGRRDWPVIYWDRFGVQHRLAPHQVIIWSEFPSPVETMNGVQMCAVTRVLRAAQLLRDLSIFQREKAAGRNPAALHLVSGVSTKAIEDAIAQHQNFNDQKGLARFSLPVVMASLDPTATISHEQIDLASLPDNFDLDTTMRWYINQLALGLGCDYQDLAPLPGRGIGTGTEALVLAQKSRGKGPALFQKGLEHLFNFHGVLPRNVTFRYDEQDNAADLETSELQKLRAETEEIRIRSGVLTPAAVRQEMLDRGEIAQEVFDALQQEADLTGNVTAQDEERLGEPSRAAPGSLGTPVQASPAGGRSPAPAPGAVKAAGDDDPEPASDFAETERLEWETAFAAELERALGVSYQDLRRRIVGAAKKGLAFWGTARKDEDDDLRARLEDAFDDDSWWAEFRTRMIETGLPTFRTVALGAAQYNADLGLGVNMMLVNEQVLDFTRTYTNEWWAALEATTRDSMRKSLLTWQEFGLGERGLPDLIDSLEPLFGPMRAELIASTEVTRLFAEGSVISYNSAGIETVEYQTVRDERVCPICVPLNGKRYPTNAAPNPPRHPRCRCALLPVANNQAIRGV